MLKLLRSNFARLWKNRIFHISSAIMLAIGIIFPISHYLNMQKGNYVHTLESGFFTYAILIAIFASVFASLFVGTEYSDGTIRNKIIVGHRRGMIYLSNLLVCIAAGVLMSLAYLVPYLCIGIPLFGFFTCGAPAAAAAVLLVFAMTTAFMALFTLIAQLTQNKAYSTAACILLTFLLLFAGIRISSALSEPEYYYDVYRCTENGVVTEEEKIPNSNYISGTKRDVYVFLYDFIPGGQALQLSAMAAAHPWQMAGYDLLILVASTGAGVLIFRRKDLK